MLKIRSSRNGPPIQDEPPSARPALEGLFCAKPFRWFELSCFPERGASYLCCPAWLPRAVGNVMESTVADVWNGATAREIRRSILDGSFKYCTEYCPHLHAINGPVQRIEDVTDPELKAIIEQKLETLPYGPRDVNAAFDRSCNLSCPTCRQEMIVETEARDEILGLQAKLEAEGVADAEMLYITGSGDAFGSPYFLAWLKRLRVESMPRLKKIHLHTNAQLWTPRVWTEIDEGVRAYIKSAEISIDAASPETYALNRRGGRWDRLLRNLDFIGGLRREGPLEFVKIHMVVQHNNFHEMPAFVELGKQFGLDLVYFSRLADWGTFDAAELARRSVHQANHPRHGELRRVLQDPRLRDPSVDLGNLTEFLS
jgi:hypothetical protein